MKKYSEDYEIVVTKDENSRERETAVYRGDYFDVTFTVGEIAKYKILSVLLLALTIVFHVGAGFIDNPGMYKFFVALPYVFAFFPLLYLALGIFHLPGETRKYRRDEIGLSFDRIKTTSRVLLIFLGVRHPWRNCLPPFLRRKNLLATRIPLSSTAGIGIFNGFSFYTSTETHPYPEIL